MLITVRGSYIIAGEIVYRKESPLVEVVLPSDGIAELLLAIDLVGQSIEATGKYEVSEDFFRLLCEDEQPNELPSDIAKEADAIHCHITSAIRRFLYAVKYCLKQMNLDETLFLVKGMTYSIAVNDWRHFPGEKLSIVASSYSMSPLDKETAEQIRDHLASGIKTFLALSFLQRAKNETQPKYKWIDATIAAELAIKEFLIQIRPEVEAILLEVPSPPLHKLYGSILEAYTGQRSPVLKYLAEGVKIRNQLVHRPEQVIIETQAAIDYLNHVEMAIGHLLSIINPSYYQRYWCVDHYFSETGPIIDAVEP